MPPLVSAAATVSCSMATPRVSVPLATTPKTTPVNAGTSAANVDDYVPVTNVPSFGVCSAPGNPAVAASPAGKAPCTPVINGPWTPGAGKVKIAGRPALHDGCQAMCAWGGVITISTPGNEGKVQVS